MRTRYLIALSVLLPLSVLLLLRQHIRDLAAVARTYASFHTYVKHHDEVLFRYPGANTDDDAATRSLRTGESVPKIIHQIFLSNGRPNSRLGKYEPAIESCERLHPDWKMYMWTDEKGRQFMADYYPAVYPHYVGYKQNIQRANILRYALLHHFGGVYLDLDVTCRVPLDAPLTSNNGSIRLTDLPLVTPGAYPAGVNNAFILARPGHAFLTQLLEKAPSRDLPWPMPYVENMLSTGCMFFSNVWMSYVLRTSQQAKTASINASDRVYILADEHGNAESHMLRGKVTTPLFTHGGASSWHGWDAAAIVMIGKHYGYFAVGLICILVTGLAAIWKLSSLVRRRRRRSSWRTQQGELKSLRLSSPA